MREKYDQERAAVQKTRVWTKGIGYWCQGVHGVKLRVRIYLTSLNIRSDQHNLNLSCCVTIQCRGSKYSGLGYILLGNDYNYVVSQVVLSAYNLVTVNPNSEVLKLSREWGRRLSRRALFN